MTRMNIFTIGYTQKSAAQFFARLERPGLVRVIDARLNNTSQLAGFTKKDDLRFFLERLLHIDYVHLPELAPTKEILGSYRGGNAGWEGYERAFMELMRERRVGETLSKDVMAGGCLLCSEPKADRCHRRLVAEYLRSCWQDVDIIHL